MNGGFGSLAAIKDDFSLMSAFPESGRSDTQKTAEMKVRFRPEAAVTRAFERRSTRTTPTTLYFESQLDIHRHLRTSCHEHPNTD